MAKAGTDFKVVNVFVKTMERFTALTVALLNQAALDSGFKPNAVSDAEIRVKSIVGVSGIPQYSNLIKIKVTPYPAWDDWGIIGSATPGGWDNDTNMTWDATKKVFTLTLDLKSSGAFKFRANDGWDINLGGNLNALTAGGDNLTITANGNYTVTLDPINLKATVTKN